MFSVQIAKSLSTEMVGDIVEEPFDFGDGTSTLLALTVTEVHADEGWFLAKGDVVHQYSPSGEPLLSAGLEGCCRIDESNNRSGGPYRVKVVVSRNAQVAVCTPKLFLPPIVSLYAVPGRPVDFLVPLSSSNAFRCLLATAGEAGGGPNPAGLVIGPGNCIITWGIPAEGGSRPFWTTQVVVEGFKYHEQPGTMDLFGSGATDFLLRFVADVSSPVCRVDHLDSGPPTQLYIFVQDSETGLAGIDVIEQTNATVFVPASAQGGDKDPVMVVGTKIDQSQSARIQLRVRDLAGNVTECDPVLTEEARAVGKPVSQILTEIPPEERVVTVLNGDPGLEIIQIEVNGRKFTVAGLSSGEERTIDVGSAIRSGMNSTITLTSRGKPGGAAAILIWEGRSD
jgi:hypothetical protein